MKCSNLSFWLRRGLVLLAVGVLCSCASGKAKVTSGVKPMGTVKDGTRRIHVASMQFEFMPTQIIVREGEPVKLLVTTTDVRHGLAIPAFDVDTVVYKDKTNTLTFTPDKPGRFPIHCSVFCGTGHASMEGELIVVPSSEETDTESGK